MERDVRNGTGSGPSTDVGKDRKSEIITVATGLFRQKGYHAASLDEIADVIGFTKPAIYYYFKSKEDILFAIVDDVIDGALSRVRRILDRDVPVSEKMYALMVENTRVVLDNLEANSVFYNERGLLSSEREKMVREREREYTNLVRDLYVEGVQTGDFRDIDPTVATATLLGASIWAYRWFDERGRFTSDEVAEQVAELLVNGFKR